MGITASARLIFAVARDGGMIGANQLTRVSAHGIPVWATVVSAAVMIITFLSFQNVAALYASPVVLLYIVYLITVASFAFGVHKMPKSGHFRWPVTILAMLLLAGEVCIMTIPVEFNDAAYVALGIIATGLVICSFQNLRRAQAV